jgi:hypothetical protein
MGEYGEDAAVLFDVRWQRQFGEDVADVLLDGAVADHEDLGNVAA